MLSAKFKPALLGAALPLLSSFTRFAPMALRAAEIPQTQERAANLARMKAEALNGWLTKHHTAACMHKLGGAPR